jgi:hypothetical protein
VLFSQLAKIFIGHCVAQVRLVMRAVPNKGFRPYLGTECFLAYVQRFDFVPQANPDPASSLYLLRRSTRTDGSRLGDIVPLTQLRARVDLTPHFGAKADTRITKENCMEYSSQFWLNKYFEKELFFALT